MNEVLNPFAPGAGNPPPELAGRSDILQRAEVALRRLVDGRHDKSQLLLGLRGVGKTVLLNKILFLAEDLGAQAVYIEAPESQRLAEQLVPELRRALIRLDRFEAAKSYTKRGMNALRNFASVFQVKVGELGLSISPEAGIADSGELSLDLSDLFVAVGEAARAANTAAVILIDEVQYLSKEELAAVIVSAHKVSQRQVPLIIFGAGLPQLAGLVGEAKSYSERLFDYPGVGALSKADAHNALAEPARRAGAKFASAALSKIVSLTQGYPYFLQEWGYQAWNVAPNPLITSKVAAAATKRAIARLDEGFFRVRFDRLTPRERDYMRAMAELGPGPHRSGDIARCLGAEVKQVAPLRGTLIGKGMIYRPAHGDTAFTVPMFDEFLTRAIPEPPQVKKRRS